jgi:hypothetical protein
MPRLATTGIYDPTAWVPLLLAVLAVLAVAGQIEGNYVREKTLGGQVAAGAKGNHGRRPKAIDDSVTFALALKARGIPIPDIAKKSTARPARTPAAPVRGLAVPGARRSGTHRRGRRRSATA